MEDIRVNQKGHGAGITACKFWRDIIDGRAVNTDTLPMSYSDYAGCTRLQEMGAGALVYSHPA